ncbi:MAG: hypothetical protein AAF628_25560 [Planctomycetota bacterium]
MRRHKATTGNGFGRVWQVGALLAASMGMVTAVAAQEVSARGPVRPVDAAASGRFANLSEARQTELVEQLEAQARDLKAPLAQRIFAMGTVDETPPVAPPRPLHDPKKYARGAPKRKLYAAGTPEHDLAMQTATPPPFLRDLHKQVYYCWRTGEVVRRAKPLSVRERFENLLHGFPPGSDVAVATILAALDQNDDQRAAAEFFCHGYADRDGRAFAGLTLYDAWNTGDVIEVPDVDAIAFERKVLGTRKFRSPIPGGAKRTWLYEQIKSSMFDFRVYRSLREAAAAAFVAGEPDLDPQYAKLVPRFHYLFAHHDHDLAAIRDLLSTTSRDQLLADTDEKVEQNSDEWLKRQDRQWSLQAIAKKLRRAALRGLDAAEAQDPRTNAK